MEQKVGFKDAGQRYSCPSFDSKVMTCQSETHNSNVVTSVKKPSVSMDGFYKRNSYPKRVIRTTARGI